MVWLIGNKGMLGTEISLLFQQNNIEFIGTDIDVDITNKETLELFVQDKNINTVINCAAYTQVDKAEDDIEKCRLLNTIAAAYIAQTAKNINAKLIHISTDYVFNGKGTKPYSENDTTAPIGVYGLTKRDGEAEILKINPDSYIVRTAWLYGKHGNNFVHTMLRLMNEKNELKVVNDQKGSPTWTKDLADTILKVINNDIPPGIYHFTNEGEITWHDFAKEIYRIGRKLGKIKNKCNILPCSSAEFPAKVTRPAYSVLNKNKIKNALGINIPMWDVSLEKYLCEN